MVRHLRRYIVLYYTILYYTILYYTVLYEGEGAAVSRGAEEIDRRVAAQGHRLHHRLLRLAAAPTAEAAARRCSPAEARPCVGQLEGDTARSPRAVVILMLATYQLRD